MCSLWDLGTSVPGQMGEFLPPGWSRGGAEPDLSFVATKEFVCYCSHISSTAGCLCLLLLLLAY